MRISRFLLTFAMGATFAFGQTAPPTAAFEKLENQGSTPSRDNPYAAAADSGWETPLIEVSPTEKRFFRTRREGLLANTARIDYGGDGSVLIGFEYNAVTDPKGLTINSIRPVYSNAG